LRTRRLRLRAFDEADAEDLWAMHSSALVLRYWDSSPWTDRERVGRFLAGCREMAEHGTGMRLAVDTVDAGRTKATQPPPPSFVGWCALNDWDPPHRKASVGYVFRQEAWGHGYATEAVRALLTWAFDTLDLNRVQGDVDTRNPASARVLEKLGFVREGTLREDCVVDGVVSDTWVHGLLRRDWRADPARTHDPLT
jgi:RimJ/RimL family protein N-acetyltransferase